MPSKKLILALVDGIYGSKSRETNLIKLQMIPETYFDLPDFLFSSSQNFESCKYLLPNDDISIANFSPYFISTLYKRSTYLLYFYSINSMKLASNSFMSSRSIFGIFLS